MSLSIGQCATLACLWEAIAPKPGNVHRGADFDDVTFGDFATSAVAMGPIMEQASAKGVGATVLAAVQATRTLVDTNTNLGMLLLIAPLAAIPRDADLRAGVQQVLDSLSAKDASLVYRAIALAQPGGMGQVEDMDVGGPPPTSLLAAMQAAAQRDDVARQYATGFQDVFERVVPYLLDESPGKLTLSERVIHAHVRLIAERGDTLIARKCSEEVSRRAAAIASQVLAAGPPGDESYHEALADFDFWLRSDGRRRNPGTTADLIAAGLFVVFRDERLPPPWR